MRGRVAAAVFGLLAAGCASTPRRDASTRLRWEDVDVAVNDVRDQLAESDFLAGRGEDAGAVRLVLRRVENISSDRIPVGEQWSMVSRVVSHRGMQELLRERGVTIQLPPEKVALLEREGFDVPALEPEHSPTHAMRAQIASATRAGAESGGGPADVRKDYYLITFTIEDLQGREVLWQGASEFAREARGVLID